MMCVVLFEGMILIVDLVLYLFLVFVRYVIVLWELLNVNNFVVVI